MRRGQIVANGQSSLPSLGRRNTRLGFFEFCEPAKEFLDTKTRKSVSDKFRMLEIALRRLLYEWIPRKAMRAHLRSGPVWISTRNTARKLKGEVQDTARKRTHVIRSATGPKNARAMPKNEQKFACHTEFRFSVLRLGHYLWALEWLGCEPISWLLASHGPGRAPIIGL